jgi:hypothetical protein
MKSRRPRVDVPRSAVAFITSIVFAALAGCASAPAAMANPATSAQFKARLLAPGTARGYLPQPLGQVTMYKSTAKPMLIPTGSVNHVCNQLAASALVLPMPSLRAGQSIGIIHPKSYAYPPSWDEGIEVFPGSEAATIMTKLTLQLTRDAWRRYAAAT